MAAIIYPITPSFAAEIGDVDLSCPIGASELAAINGAFAHYVVLIFPDQHLSQDQHLDFARHFGPLEPPLRFIEKMSRCACAPSLQMCPTSITKAKYGESRQRLFQLGQSPLAYRQLVQTAAGASVVALCAFNSAARRAYGICRMNGRPTRCRRKPSAASTRSSQSIRSSTRAPASASPTSAMRNARECRRYRRWSCARSPSPGANRSTWRPTGRILGMSEDDGRALIDELVTHATQRQFVYTHRWRVHDLVIWDNRCTMHRGTDFDDLRWKRDMQRATVSDVANSCEQEGVAVAAA